MNLSPGRKKLLYRTIAVLIIFILILKTADITVTKIIEKKTSKLSAVISEKTGLHVSITDSGYRLFPLKITAEHINIQKNEQTVAALESCSILKPISLMTSKEKNLNVTCGELSFDSREVSDMLRKKLSSQSEKTSAGNNGKKSVTGYNLDLTIEKTTVRLMGSQETFRTDFKIKGYAGVARIRGTNGINNAGFLEIVFSIPEQKADLRFEKVSLKMFDKLIVSEIRPVNYSGIVDGHVRIWKNKNKVNFSTDFTVENIMVEHPLIDSVPYKLPFLRIESGAFVDLLSKKVTVETSKFSVGGIEGVFEGSYGPDGKSLKLNIKNASLNELRTLVNGNVFKDFNLNGHIDFSLDYAQMKDQEPVFDVEGDVVDARQISDRLDYLVSTFPYSFTDDKGNVKVMTIGPSNPNFVPIEYLPEHVYWAVVISEDAGFFMHNGVDFKELTAAVLDNIRNRKMRGGSTITQQLAKNLFLNRKKTLIRKFQELLLAIELDATFSKHKLLEIYLNIIEWAPGVFGISQAAYYYFDKSPYELTPLESAYLASVIPGPYKYHYQFLTGNVNEKWMSNLHRILGIMQENGHISFEQYLEAIGEVITFRTKK